MIYTPKLKKAQSQQNDNTTAHALYCQTLKKFVRSFLWNEETNPLFALFDMQTSKASQIILHGSNMAEKPVAHTIHYMPSVIWLILLYFFLASKDLLEEF